MFEAEATPDQEQIAEYEGLLKTIPQIQMGSDSNVSNSHDSFCLCIHLLFSFIFKVESN